MKTYKIVLIIFLGILFLSLQNQKRSLHNAKPGKMSIMEIDDSSVFHGDDVEGNIRKGKWIELYKTKGHYVIKWVKPIFRHEFDDMLDTGNQKTGISVSLPVMPSNYENPVYIIYGLEDTLKDGPVISFKCNSFLLPGESYKINIGGKVYKLIAKGIDSSSASEPKYIFHRNYSLTLSAMKEGNNISQQLGQIDGYDDRIFTILWVGDIDRDGLPDLIIDLNTHENSGGCFLFLSSKAGNGKLMKMVAGFTIIGC